MFNPVDSGGITNFGISIHTLAEYRNGMATSDDVRKLTMKDARDIYLKLFWQRLGLDRFDSMPALQLALFDFAVNSGCHAAVRGIQNVLIESGHRIKLDGVLGTETLAAAVRAAQAKSELKLCVSLVRNRRMLVARICQRDKTQVAFLAGWIGRTHALDDAMIALATPQQKAAHEN